jgi:hypothetical protein
MPTCRYSQCASNHKDCSSVAPDTNGCETDVSSDINNCGDCGNHCNTSNNHGTACSSGVCSNSGCNANYADCNSDTRNLDECETLTTTTAHCGSCAPCASPGPFVTTSTCYFPPDMGPGQCEYTCASCATDTSKESASACNGTRCSYSCAAGNVDCNYAGGQNTDGCECPTSTTPPDGGCCGTGCQTAHTNCTGGTCTGLGQSYYDCTSTGIFNQTQAEKACVAKTGDLSVCKHFICVAPGNKETNDDVICSNNGVAPCQCWDFPNATGGQLGGGPFGVGHVNLNCLCASSGVDPSWN